MLPVLLLVGSGALIFRRLLEETVLSTALCGGAAFAGVLFLLLLNALSRTLEVSTASVVALVLIMALALASFRLTAPARTSWPMSRGGRIFALALMAFIYLYTTISQNVWVDDDYWIHTPLMGLLKAGRLPPTHPFFADITMNGHYGRDLLIAGLSSLTGGNILQTQTLLTTTVSVLAGYLMLATLLRSTGSQPAALLGVTMVTFGINVGSRVGAIDTFQNNNAIVQLLVILYLYQLESTLTGPSRWLVPAACGLTLSCLSFTYETHFGLCVMATLSLLPFLRTQRELVRRIAIVMALAGTLALVQGGPFTDLVVRRLSPDPAPVVLSEGEMNQRQVVSLRFPKENLFSLQLGDGEYRRLSAAFRTFPILLPWVAETSGESYQRLWSAQVLQIHWFATLLGPLAALYLARRKLWTSLFFPFFALYAYMVPGVVDFGPVYEFEYFRWQYAAGVGFAAAVGMALGLLYQTLAQRSRAVFTSGLLLLLAFLYLNLAPFFLTLLPYRLAPAGSLEWSSLLLPLRTNDWLRLHSGYLGVTPTDTVMARTLLGHIRPGDRVLVNFPEHAIDAIMLESTLGGITSSRFVGHSLPLEGEAVGTPPYHMAAPARAFWGSLSPLLLRQLGVQWLYLRPGPEVNPQVLAGLSRVPGLKLEAQHGDATGRYRLYRFDQPAMSLALRSEQFPLEIVGARVGEGREESPGKGWSFPTGQRYLRPSCYYPATLVLRNRSQRSLPAGTVLAYQWKGSSPREVVSFSISRELLPNGQIEQPIGLVAPHLAGPASLIPWVEVDGALHPGVAHTDTVSIK